MNEERKFWCGIDISKDDMTAALDMDGALPVRKLPVRSFKRTLDGLQDMLEWCASQNAALSNLAVFMESTGVYSMEVLQWLRNRFPAIHVSVGNPRHVKHFIEGEHLGNKTDAMDARAIARMGTVQRPCATPPPPPEYLQLQALVRARNDLLTKMRSLEVSMDAMLDKTSVAYSAFGKTTKVMDREIAKIETAIDDLVDRMPEIGRTVELMCTMPGIGRIAAVTIISELGPFSSDFPRSSFSAYTGLQPVRRQSGTSVNSTHLGKNGSPLLRKVLYMCSVHAVKKIPSLASFHSRLVAKGKSPISARCACMRKMLLILRSMVLNKREFQENYVSSFKKKRKAI